MVQLHAKECVCNTEVMIGAKLQKALTIAFANTKVTKAIRPGALIVAHSSVEIAEGISTSLFGICLIASVLEVRVGA